LGGDPSAASGRGISIKQIVRVLGVSKNTVRAALRSAGPPKYERVERASIVDEVEPRIRELLRAFPTMPATVIAERIGWNRSMTVLKERVAELRPVYLPPAPASRTAHMAGEIAQFDLWFPPISVPVGFGQTRPAAPTRPPPKTHDHEGSTFSRRYGVNFGPSLTHDSSAGARPAQLMAGAVHGSAPGGPPGGRHGPGG
jgi:transcriptional regulator with XRE-family HTH domain